MGLKIQIKHLDHRIRIYIKSMGDDSVCRNLKLNIGQDLFAHF